MHWLEVMESERLVCCEQIVIRGLQLSDLPRMMEIERLCFKNPWPLEWFRTMILAHMVTWGVTIEDKLIGYLIALPSSDRVHLANIAIDEPYRRRGISRELLKRLYDFARRHGQERIILEVRPSNLSAIALYESEDFVVIGREKGYYRGEEDALIYCLEL